MNCLSSLVAVCDFGWSDYVWYLVSQFHSRSWRPLKYFCEIFCFGQCNFALLLLPAQGARFAPSLVFHIRQWKHWEVCPQSWTFPWKGREVRDFQSFKTKSKYCCGYFVFFKCKVQFGIQCWSHDKTSADLRVYIVWEFKGVVWSYRWNKLFSLDFFWRLCH